MNNLVTATPATETTLPPITALGYDYVVATNGLFIRAEDSRMAACVPIALTGRLPGLGFVAPHVELKPPRVPVKYLWAIYNSACQHLPNEVHYQLHFSDGEWCIIKPAQHTTPVSVEFADSGEAVIDLHSHATMPPFFSDTDNADERGLRFYCVIGHINTRPQIMCRVGVYGHHWPVQPQLLFEGLGIFTEASGK